MFKESNITLMVADLDRAVKFYTDMLGLKLVRRFGGHWAEVEAPGVRIGLHPGGKAKSGTPSESHMSIGFRVDDIDAAMNALKERGITFTNSRADKGSRNAYFSDPDGTPLYLIEIKFG
jgi:catechol 2,3-dioxygenase-like lactoylglutathione lyase family enzyme